MYSDSFLSWVVPEFGVRVHCSLSGSLSRTSPSGGSSTISRSYHQPHPKTSKVFGPGGGDEVHDAQKMNCELSDPGSSLSRQQNQLTPIFPNNWETEKNLQRDLGEKT